MPYPNEHAARVKSPDAFQDGSFRRKNIAPGIDIIIGRLKGETTTTTQAYRFKKASFTASEAKKWLADHDVKYILFEKATEIQSFEKNIYIQCFTLAMSASDIIKNIPENIYNKIKQKNPHPYFQAYSIIQDGTSNPKDINDNTYKPIEWGKEVISKVKGIIKKGLQFFIGHNKDNSTEGRKSIGEVVSDFSKKIGDKLHHIVIGYFPDRSEAQKYDVCSIEANIITEEYPNLSIAKKIQDITGIALGNSQVDKPAFAGAVRLGTVQAFGDNDPDPDPDLDPDPDPPKKNIRKEIPMTFEEIKQAVKSMNIFPNQLFTEDDLKGDNVFGRLFTENEKLKTENQEHKTKISEKEEEIKTLNRNISEADAHNKLENILSTFESDNKKLTDLQKNFINKRFDPKSLEEISDEKITDFVNTSLKEYPEFASIFVDNNNKGNESNGSESNNDDDSGSETKDDVDQVVEDILK
jgi:hypothetical protein